VKSDSRPLTAIVLPSIKASAREEQKLVAFLMAGRKTIPGVIRVRPGETLYALAFGSHDMPPVSVKSAIELSGPTSRRGRKNLRGRDERWSSPEPSGLRMHHRARIVFLPRWSTLRTMERQIVISGPVFGMARPAGADRFLGSAGLAEGATRRGGDARTVKRIVFHLYHPSTTLKVPVGGRITRFQAALGPHRRAY